MKKRGSVNILFFIILILTFSFQALAGEILPLQGNADINGTPISSGGIVVELWDGPDVAGSNPIYNSSENFTGAGNVSNGKFDIVLGSVGDELNLEYGKTYYIDFFIDGKNMNFSGQERQVFMSSVGIINASFLNTSNDYAFSSLTVANITAATVLLNVSHGDDLLIVNSTGIDFDSGTLYVDPLTNTVGIGTTAPLYALDVQGFAAFGNLVHFGANVSMADNLTVGGNALYVDSSSGRVGIGTSFPAFRLDVYGDINTTGLLTNATSCSNGFVSDSNGLLYCSPTTFIFDDTSINASVANLDTQVFNNATERLADNSTLTGMIVAINADAYNPGNIVFANESLLNATYMRLGVDEFNDLSVNQSISNLDVQVFNNATERVADNSTLTSMISGLNVDAYNPANIAFLNESELNNSYVRRIAWTDHDNYPDACGAGQYATQIGDSLTCSEPSGIVQWGWTNTTGMVYNTQSVDNVGIGTTNPLYRLEVLDNASLSNTLFVTNGSLVGIGTSSPAFRLDVYGDINATAFLMNATSCANGLVTDANGLLYCSPTPHTFDDTSINASITNLDTQVYNNATERTADNTTLTNMINGKTPQWGWTNTTGMVYTTQLGDKVGIGTVNPSSILHLNVSDANTGTVTDMLTLEHVNASGAVTAGIGSAIMFKTIDSASDVENVSMISGILSNVANGTERGALLFYTGYGDQDGIISNLSSSETMRLDTEGLRVTGNLTVTGASHLGSMTFDTNATFSDSINVSEDLEAGGVLFVDGRYGNVGIGTTNPDALLNVNGILKIDNTGALDIYNAGTAAANYERLRIFPSGNVFYFQEGHTGSGNIRPMQFQINNIDAMRIDTTGNVGIGTTSPGATLEVVNQSAVNALFNVTDGSDTRFLVNGAGNVGIGTTSPSAKLDIQAGSGNDILYAGNSNGVFRLYNDGTLVLARVSGATAFSFGTSWAPVSVGSAAFYSSNTDFTGDINIYSGKILKLFAGVGTGQTGVWDASTGNVGIGTTTPSALLDVAGAQPLGSALAMNISGVLYVNESNVGIGTTSPTVLLTVGTTGTGSALDSNEVFQFASNSASMYGTLRSNNGNVYLGVVSTGGFIGTQTNANFTLRTNAGDRVTIDTSGNVGIGTTAPSGNLHIYGGSGSYTYLDAPATGEAALRFTTAAALDMQLYRPSNSADLRVYSAALGDIVTFQKTTGNIGIGTSSPSALLDVGGNQALGSALAANLSGVLYVNESNVGIGTTAPGAKLSVAGDIELSGTAATAYEIRSSSIDGADNKYLALSSTGTAGPTRGSYIELRGNEYANNIGMLRLAAGQAGTTGTEGFIIFETGITTKMVIDRSGNVGIGTTTPSALLDVAGSQALGSALAANLSGVLYVNESNVGIGTTSPANLLHIGSGGQTQTQTASSYGGIYVNPNLANAQITVETNGGIEGGMFGHTSGVFYMGSWSNHDVRLAANNADVMTLKSGGNVGIGTTNPGAKLEVDGTFNATGASGKTGLYVDSDGEVGIGTTSPNVNLVIRKGGTATTPDTNAALGIVNEGIAYINLYDSATTAQVGIINNGGEGYVGTITGHPFSLATGNTKYLTVDTAGNVGIGTTAPGDAKLNVTGTIDAWQVTVNGSAVGASGGGWTDDGAIVRLTTSTDSIGIGTSSPGATLEVVNQSAVNALFNVTDGSDTRFLVNGAGNVGIGTTNPLYTVHILGETIYIENGNGAVKSGGNLYLDSAVSGGGGDIFLRTDGEVSGLVLKDNTGFVGIGTTAPTHGLNVAGDANFSGSTGTTTNEIFTIKNVDEGEHAILSLDNTDATAPYDYTSFLRVGTNGTYYGEFGANVGTVSNLYGIGLYAYSGYGIRFHTDGSSTPKMIIGTTGNVGIGTTTPGANLDVGGNILFNTTGTADAGQTPNLVFKDTLDNPLSDAGWSFRQFSFVQQNGSTVWEQGWSAGGLKFTVDGNDALFLKKDGNVGIGTTAPGAKLAIQGTGTYGSTNWGTASDMAIRSSEMTDSAYHSILQLVSIRQSLTTGNAANGYLGFSTIDDSNGQGMLDAGRIAIVNEGGGNRNSPTALSFWTNPGGADDTVAATEKVRITSGGNVGIGMTPTVQFELSGSVGQKATGTAWSNPSDIKIKDVLRPFSDGLKVLEGIHPIYYKLNGKGGVTPDGEEHIGIVAQDIQKVAPYTVSSYKAKLNKEDKEDTDLLRFDASALTFVTINAVKEQQTQIEDLKSENEALKSLVCLDHPEAKVCKKGVASEQPVQPVNETEMPSEQVVPVEAPVIPVNIAIPYCDLQTGVCNSAPVIDSFSPEGDVSMSVGGSQEFSVVKSDADNDTLSTQWYVDNLAVADQVSDSYTFASSELGVFEVKVLVTDGKDYSTHKWVVTVEEGQSFGITGAAVSKVNLGRNALLSWIKSLFY